MKIQLKFTGSMFIPITQDDEQERWLSTLDRAKVLNADIVTPRNYKFHKKFFGLLNMAFEFWPGPAQMEWQGEVIQPEKTTRAFREWVIIQAGYYSVAGTPDGNFKLVADSISFAKMEEAEFQQLYNHVINVILHKVVPTVEAGLQNYFANQVLNFD
jgi:hypothetical protein